LLSICLKLGVNIREKGGKISWGHVK